MKIFDIALDVVLIICNINEVMYTFIRHILSNNFFKITQTFIYSIFYVKPTQNKIIVIFIQILYHQVEKQLSMFNVIMSLCRACTFFIYLFQNRSSDQWFFSYSSKNLLINYKVATNGLSASIVTGFTWIMIVFC